MQEKSIEEKYSENQGVSMNLDRSFCRGEKEPLTKLAPRLQKVIFLGFAPNVTNGYFVMRQDDKIELTSNIADEPGFDAPSELMEQRPGTSTDQPPQSIHNRPFTDKELDAVMGPDGGGGWYWGDDWNKAVTFGRPDDPMEVISNVQLAKNR